MAVSSRELERKFIGIDKQKIVSSLESAGAKKNYDGPVEQTYFDYPNLDLYRSSTFLRLRRMNGHAEIGIKKQVTPGVAEDVQSYDVNVSSYEQTSLILGLVGFSPYVVDRKRRLEYELDDVKFSIDEYDNYGEIQDIPPFMEVESDELEKIKKTIHTVDLEWENGMSWSRSQLLEHYLGRLPADSFEVRLERIKKSN